MADTLYLPDGTTEVLFHPLDDLQRLIHTRLGNDAEALFIGLREAADYTMAKVETDLSSYESSLGSNATAFQDILEQLKPITQQIAGQRINRLALTHAATEITKIINNQI